MVKCQSGGGFPCVIVLLKVLFADAGSIVGHHSQNRLACDWCAISL